MLVQPEFVDRGGCCEQHRREPRASGGTSGGGAKAEDAASGDSGAVRADAEPDVHAVPADAASEDIVLVEVQLDVDRNKPFSWPLYMAAARALYRCDVCLLVVTIDEGVAAWARRPVALGPAGPLFHPTVLGPATVPHAIEPSAPELAVLSALAHGAEEPDTLSRALLSIDAMKDDDRRRAYFDLVRYHLGAALDRALEAIMATSERPYLSDFANDYFAKGRAEGKAEGRAEGARIALVAVVTSRGLSLDDADRARIAACSDAATLEAWVGRAARAAAVAEIFAD